MVSTDQMFDLLQKLYDQGEEQLKAHRLTHKLVRRIINKLDDPDGTKAAERSKNNAFNRLMNASNEICEFMGLAAGSQVSRSQCIKAFNSYIRENGLKCEDDGRRFKPDSTLRRVFDISDDQEVVLALSASGLVGKHLTPVEGADPADKNGDGRVTRSEAQEHRESKAAPSQPKKAPTKTTKSATIRAPPKKKVAA